MTSPQLIADRYRIVRPLREETTAKTFLAIDSLLDIEVVVQLLGPVFAGNPHLAEFVQQYTHLQSECVVAPTNHGIDTLRGQPFLVWPFVAGEDLQSLISTRDFLPPEQSYALLAQFVDAVATLHRAGLCHGGLKPRYVLIHGAAGEPARLRLTNSGLASLRARNQDRKGGRGSPLWMAPELTQPDSAPTAMSDVWSLGLVAFFLLTGRPYFRHVGPPAATPLQQLREVMLDNLVSASERATTYGRGDALPRGFDGWFARCLNRSVAQRWQSAVQAQAALQTLLLSRRETSREAAEPSRLSSLLGPLGLTLVLVLGGGLGLAYYRGHSAWGTLEKPLQHWLRRSPASLTAEALPRYAATLDAGAPRGASSAAAEHACAGVAPPALEPSGAGGGPRQTPRQRPRPATAKPSQTPSVAPPTPHATEQRQCELGSRSACQTLVLRLRKGCTSGRDEDCTGLGTLFLEGRVLQRDMTRAAMLLSRACRNGDQTACTRLGQLTPLDEPPAQSPHPEYKAPPRVAPQDEPPGPPPHRQSPRSSEAPQRNEV